MKRREQVIWILGVLILGIVLVLLYLRPIKSMTILQEYSNYMNYGLGNVEKENIIQQHFVASGNYLDGIELFFANIDEESKGSIYLEITDEKNNSIWEKTLDVKSIEAGKFVLYPVRKRVERKGDYYLSLSYSEESENADLIPKVMYADIEYNIKGTKECYRGMDLEEQNLAITYHYAETMPYWQVASVVAFLFIIIITGLKRK